MSHKKKSRNKKARRENTRMGHFLRFTLPQETKRAMWGAAMFLTALIVVLSFFDLAGVAGRAFMRGATLLLGRTIFIVPALLTAAGFIFFHTTKRNFLSPVLFALFLGVLGIGGILGSLGIYHGRPSEDMGGWTGYFISWVPMTALGIWASLAIFSSLILLAFVAVWQMRERKERGEQKELEESAKHLPSVFRKVINPKFRVQEVSPQPRQTWPQESRERTGNLAGYRSFTKKRVFSEESGQDIGLFQQRSRASSRELPPLDILEPDRGQAQSGDIKINSAIIKRTLENFGIPVEISEVNVGPAVTQYAVKPAEGIKLSRIVSLSNDLALALAAHPIRIEAPIPGRPLVGIEVPNRVRVQVRLRNLLEQLRGQPALSQLMFTLGRDVSGEPVYADLNRMPHLLVAGSTGTGKTIGLNAILISLLYQHSSESLRLILVDPKRVEFPVYNDLPHLLTPVIYDAQRTVNALKWLVGEMERRFEMLSLARARDLTNYNNARMKEGQEIVPYIVFVVDELADLMAARGREMEAGVVRLAQMARAVGIHLVVATQRPSVEVITGLIKANITSRMAFQVASQVDSRTVFDAAGAEKLLGLGDMLFMSAEISKPKRIQGAYVSEKEVRKIVRFIKEKSEEGEGDRKEEGGARAAPEDAGVKMAEDLEKSLEGGAVGDRSIFMGDEEDPLYEEARKLVTETRKASASFLQRRLRVGYARAARLIDILEERRVVGPGEGAKPREVLVGIDSARQEEENEEWEKV